MDKNNENYEVEIMGLTKHFSDLISGKIITFTWEVEEGWRVLNVSSNVQSILGYSVEEFISGKIVYADLIHKDDIAKVEQEVENSLANDIDEFTHEIYRIRDADGNFRHVYDLSLIHI